MCGSGSDPEENCVDDDTTLYKVREKEREERSDLLQE